LHEEVIAAGGAIREGRFSRLGVRELERVVDKGSLDPATGPALDDIVRAWDSHAESLLRALEVRAAERSQSLERTLEARAEQEVNNLTEVMTELAQTIETELKRPLPDQFELWQPQERHQLERDRRALEARLAQIPADIERETAAIRRRYLDPTPRMFPAAITILIPTGRGA
jgi:cobalamin biosynthesis Mg chelatase CobN